MGELPYNAVLFDLDGTLLDTIRDIAEAMNTVLQRYGFPIHATGTYRDFVGNGMEVLVRRVLPEESRDPGTVALCHSALIEEYEANWRNNSRPYEGVPELLDALAARNMKLSVLSNKPDEFVKTMVAELLPRWPLQPVLGASPAFPKKPDPAAALEIAARLSLSPAEFLYLGDTDVDMKTAVAAGMHPVGVLWGFRTGEELIRGGAKTVIAKPMELLDLVSSKT